MRAAQDNSASAPAMHAMLCDSVPGSGYQLPVLVHDVTADVAAYSAQVWVVTAPIRCFMSLSIERHHLIKKASSPSSSLLCDICIAEHYIASQVQPGRMYPRLLCCDLRLFCVYVN